ncbi:hypothetical protein NNU90_002444 [Citrobacter farmeri]|nr:hypothetical protein [Citrobacter farmeri]
MIATGILRESVPNDFEPLDILIITSPEYIQAHTMICVGRAGGEVLFSSVNNMLLTPGVFLRHSGAVGVFHVQSENFDNFTTGVGYVFLRLRNDSVINFMINNNMLVAF